LAEFNLLVAGAYRDYAF